MGLCVFNLPIFLCIIVRMFCTSSYYHQIRTKNERSWNNGIRCITCYVIPHIDSILQLSVTWQPLVNVSYPNGGTCWKGNKIDYPDGWVRWRSVWVKGSRSSCCSNPPELMLSRHSGHTLILSYFFLIKWSFLLIYTVYLYDWATPIVWSLNEQIAFPQSDTVSLVHSKYDCLYESGPVQWTMWALGVWWWHWPSNHASSIQWVK